MKNIFLAILTCIFFCATSLAQKSTPKPSSTASTKLANISDTLNYAIGSYLAQWVNNQGFLINNPSIFIKGMDDIFQNKPRLLPDSIINPLISAYQQITQKDRAIRLEQQVFTNIKQRPGIGILPNGVHYFILKAAQGQRPNATDSVVVNLKGALADGTVFEDISNKTSTSIPLSQLIVGLSEAIQLMPVGSKWQIYIPAALAHGEKGVSNGSGGYIIPPGSALIYEIELLAIKPPVR